jgi:glucose/arabinose dehydrogenase
VRVTADPEGKNAKEEVFASGWIAGPQDFYGRPDDIIVAKDGSILVSDDWAGAVYQISYKK